MDAKQLGDLGEMLKLADDIAAAIVSDPVQGQSPNAAALRCRIVAAQESLAAHQAWLAQQTPPKK